MLKPCFAFSSLLGLVLLSLTGCRWIDEAVDDRYDAYTGDTGLQSHRVDSLKRGMPIREAFREAKVIQISRCIHATNLTSLFVHCRCKGLRRDVIFEVDYQHGKATLASWAYGEYADSDLGSTDEFDSDVEGWLSWQEKAAADLQSN